MLATHHRRSRLLVRDLPVVVPVYRCLDTAARRRRSRNSECWVGIDVDGGLDHRAADRGGYHSETRGRRPLLLIGFAIEPVRAGLPAFTTDYPFLIVAQLLDGISGAIIGVQ
jgi:hypothetical protein